MEENVVTIEIWEDGDWRFVDPELEEKDNNSYYRYIHLKTGKSIVTEPGVRLPPDWLDVLTQEAH
jgi:hypothetical protein